MAFTSTPVVFGEILFDVFPDGTEVLGGAPFNLACHLHGLGLRPHMVSRVGDDLRGSRVLAWMAGRGMDTSGVQTDAAHPTGTVQVALTHGQPAYDIRPGAAWDFIAGADSAIGRECPDSSLPAEAPCGEAESNSRTLVCSGTLALRETVSRTALTGLLQGKGRASFVDLNLRDPWWNPEIIDSQVRSSEFLKVSAEEAALLLAQSEVTCGAIEEIGRGFCQSHGLRLLAVTLGAAGAVLATPNEVVKLAPSPRSHVVDTVGAGDAFSAMLARGIICGFPLRQIGSEAVRFASEICGIRGAIPASEEVYRPFL